MLIKTLALTLFIALIDPTPALAQDPSLRTTYSTETPNDEIAKEAFQRIWSEHSMHGEAFAGYRLLEETVELSSPEDPFYYFGNSQPLEVFFTIARRGASGYDVSTLNCYLARDSIQEADSERYVVYTFKLYSCDVDSGSFRYDLDVVLTTQVAQMKNSPLFNPSWKRNPRF